KKDKKVELQMAEETSDTKNPEYISNPFVQKELYDLIEKVYFTNFTNQTVDQEKTSEYNDTADFELKNLDYESPDVKINVKNVIKKLQIQHEIVGRKLSDIILQNSQSYSKELKRVSDFKQVLEDSYQICRISRRSLSMCLNSYIYSQLRLLTRQSKKIQLIKLLETIEDIKGLTNITNNIIHLIGVSTRDYLQALNLCSKIEKSFEKYDHLRCINCLRGLKKTIEECYKLIEENSMASLLKSCRKYDESLFANACLSCQKLNNFKNFFQKLNENFVNTINNVSLQTLKRLIVSRRFPLDGNEISNQVLAAQVEKFIAELKQKNFTNELFSEEDDELVERCTKKRLSPIFLKNINI
ncbi:syndetin isoform X1, partial [Brachionus plicatilis]